MQHEFPVLLTDQGIHPLLVCGCAQRRNRQGLRFASGEKGRAMRSGQHADFTRDGTNISQSAPIYALALVNNRRAHDFAGQLFQGFCNLPASVGELFPERRSRFFLGGLDGIPALQFSRNRQSRTELLGRCGPNTISQLGINRGLRELSFWLSGDPDKFVLHVENRSRGFLSKEQCLKHVFFRYHARAALNHDNGIPASGNKQVNIAVLELALQRIDHQFPLQASNPYSGNWPPERDIGDLQGCRGTD